MAAPRSNTEQPIRLLYADDHPAVRTALRTLLDRIEDIELVGEAEDGDMALALARVLRPDLVMLDIDMPRMSGPEAAAAIKAQLPETRILYFTGDRRLTADASGSCDGIVYKTDPVSELLAWIRQVGRVAQEPLAFANNAREALPAGVSAEDRELTRAAGGERTPIRFRASFPNGDRRPSEPRAHAERRSPSVATRAYDTDSDEWMESDTHSRELSRARADSTSSQSNHPNRRISDPQGESRLQAVPLADGGLAIRDGSRLTPRQVGVLKHVAAGYTNRRTAEELGI